MDQPRLSDAAGRCLRNRASDCIEPTALAEGLRRRLHTSSPPIALHVLTGCLAAHRAKHTSRLDPADLVGIEIANRPIRQEFRSLKLPIIAFRLRAASANVRRATSVAPASNLTKERAGGEYLSAPATAHHPGVRRLSSLDSRCFQRPFIHAQAHSVSVCLFALWRFRFRVALASRRPPRAGRTYGSGDGNGSADQSAPPDARTGCRNRDAAIARLDDPRTLRASGDRTPAGCVR
ncbi:MAG: hypothetical protein KatS3mg126_2388 [Lysobacteraceae bacterium]|nr:MAG: hypothetical protein KatS3mg126_2388 [Xanthomonadaceae bacterium]